MGDGKGVCISATRQFFVQLKENQSDDEGKD